MGSGSKKKKDSTREGAMVNWFPAMDGAAFHIGFGNAQGLGLLTMVCVLGKVNLFGISVVLTSRACWLITRLGRPENAADPAVHLADLIQLSNSNASRLTHPSISPADRTAEQCTAVVHFGHGTIGPTRVSPQPYCSSLEGFFEGCAMEALLAPGVPLLVPLASALCISIAIGVASVSKSVEMLPTFTALAPQPSLIAAAAMQCLSFFIGYLAAIYNQHPGNCPCYLVKKISLPTLTAGAFVFDIVADVVLKHYVGVLIPGILNPLPEEQQRSTPRRPERAAG